jgi:hypothetical protein
MEKALIIVLGAILCSILAMFGVLAWFGVGPFIVKLSLSLLALFSSAVMLALWVNIWRD